MIRSTICLMVGMKPPEYHGSEAKRIVGALPKRRLEAELEPALVS